MSRRPSKRGLAAGEAPVGRARCRAASSRSRLFAGAAPAASLAGREPRPRLLREQGRAEGAERFLHGQHRAGDRGGPANLDGSTAGPVLLASLPLSRPAWPRCRRLHAGLPPVALLTCQLACPAVADEAARQLGGSAGSTSAFKHAPIHLCMHPCADDALVIPCAVRPCNPPPPAHPEHQSIKAPLQHACGLAGVAARRQCLWTLARLWRTSRRSCTRSKACTSRTLTDRSREAARGSPLAGRGWRSAPKPIVRREPRCELHRSGWSEPPASTRQDEYIYEEGPPMSTEELKKRFNM